MEKIPLDVEQHTNHSLSIIHHALRASRRRLAVGLISHRTFSSGELRLDDVYFQASNPEIVITVRQLAKEIVAIEEDISVDHATGDSYHNVYNALTQTHLPELDDVGAIIYHDDRKQISPASNLIVLSMVATITSPVAQMLFHNALIDVHDRETTSM